MSKTLKMTIAAGLVVLLSGAASAQTRPSRVPQPQQIDQNYSYGAYGLDTFCKNRPFANGCDKRGVW